MPFLQTRSHTLPHIISCPKLFVPLVKAINAELKGRGVGFVIPTPDIFLPNAFLPLLAPCAPSSVAHLPLLALSCGFFK